MKFPLLWKFYFSKWKFYFSADNIKDYFKLDETASYALSLLAKNNRKRFSINRKIQHFKALSTLKYLLR
ncbi:ATP-binding protein, partial [Campylobacter coli]|nr:ATP-binding protein [Campylobacter coli]